MKKQILTIISLILTIGMILPTANAEEISTYSDYVVEGQSTYADSFGLMKGYDDGTFKPDNNMTRAEFTSALMRAAVIANPDAQLAEINFSDIDKSYWAYDDIAKAVSIGFISGYDDGTFRPADNVTYEQAITMIFNVLGYKPVADLYGGYPHAYMSLGYYNRFFKSSTDNRNGNIEMNETKEKTAITRRDAMDMLGRRLLLRNVLSVSSMARRLRFSQSVRKSVPHVCWKPVSAFPSPTWNVFSKEPTIPPSRHLT